MREHLQKIVKWLHRLALVGVGLVVLLIVRRYDFEKLDDKQQAPLEGRVARGAYVVFSDVDEDTVLGKGSLVEARVTLTDALAKRVGQREGLVISEILGVPGTEIGWLPRDDGMVELTLDGGRTSVMMRPEWQKDIPASRRLMQGPIPSGHYLLINPASREHTLDSRQVGLFPREALQRKLAHL